MNSFDFLLNFDEESDDIEFEVEIPKSKLLEFMGINDLMRH